MSVGTVWLPWAKPSQAIRVKRLVDAHYDALWRLLCRLGVRQHQAEDVAQEVLLVVARRLADIEPGKERAFMMAAAVRAASQARRKQQRHPEERPHPSARRRETASSSSW